MPFMAFNISHGIEARCLATVSGPPAGRRAIATAFPKPVLSKGLPTSAPAEAPPPGELWAGPGRRFHRDPKAEPSGTPVLAEHLWAPRDSVTEV